MKKLIYLLLILSLTGCLGTKKVTEKSTEKTTIEKSETTKDSVSTVKVNKAIDDQVSTKISDTGDPYLDAKIDEILEKLNTKKTSGGNSYSFTYDKLKRELIAEFKVGQTQDSITVTNKEILSEKSTEEKIDEYISKKITMLPWWIWLIVVFLLRKQIFGILGFFFPAIGGVKTFSNLIPKRKNANQ